MAYKKKTYNASDYTSGLSSAKWTGSTTPTYSSDTQQYKKESDSLASQYKNLSRDSYNSKDTTDAYSSYKSTMANLPGEYKDSDYLTGLKNNLQDVLNSKPSDFQYDSTALDEVYNKIMNRDDFEFDLGSSSLYQQYKDQYVALGQQAMADTMGQAAAMTGGYGSSYATSAGQQAYQQELQNLNDIVPQLYEQALNTYESEGNWLLNQYNTASSDRDFSYNNWRDTVADWQTDRSYAQQAMSDQQTYERNAYDSDYSNTLNTANMYLNAYGTLWDQDQTRYENDSDKLYNLYTSATDNYWNGTNRDLSIWQQQNSDAWNALNFDEGVAEYNGNTKFAADQATEESAQAADDSQLGWSNYDLNYYDTHADNERADKELDEQIREYDQDYLYQQGRDQVADEQADREYELEKTVADDDSNYKWASLQEEKDQNDIQNGQADYSNETSRIGAISDLLGTLISGSKSSSDSSSSSSYLGGSQETQSYIEEVEKSASTIPVGSWSSTASSYYSKIVNADSTNVNTYIKQAVNACKSGKITKAELKSIMTDALNKREEDAK